jgi:phosphoribosylformylglycinamidine synthase
MKAKVHIMLKKAVLDPQGKAIENALASIGFKNIEDVRQGNILRLNSKEKTAKRPRRMLKECVNPFYQIL